MAGYIKYVCMYIWDQPTRFDVWCDVWMLDSVLFCSQSHEASKAEAFCECVVCSLCFALQLKWRVKCDRIEICRGDLLISVSIWPQFEVVRLDRNGPNSTFRAHLFFFYSLSFWILTFILIILRSTLFLSSQIFGGYFCDIGKFLNFRNKKCQFVQHFIKIKTHIKNQTTSSQTLIVYFGFQKNSLLKSSVREGEWICLFAVSRVLWRIKRNQFAIWLKFISLDYCIAHTKWMCVSIFVRFFMCMMFILSLVPHLRW